MAAVMTYSSLVADLKVYCERVNDDAFDAQIPRLVMLAENRVATDLKTEGVQAVVTGALPLADNMAKPAYWRDTVSFLVTRANGKKFNLLPRSYEYARQYWPNAALTGEPRFYADYNFDNFLIVPTPAAALNFELCYHARLDPLDDAHQTNWMTANAPQLLWYAAMVEAQTFLKNEDKMAMWGGLYNDSLGGLKQEDSGRSEDRTTVPS